MKNLVIVSDLHINSTISPCSGKASQDDGGYYHPSKSQQWLNACLKDFCDTVDSLAGETVMVLNGDTVDNNKHSKYQLITSNRASMLDNAVGVLTPLVAGRKTFIVRGTAAHTGDSSELEEILGRMIGSEVLDGSNYSHWLLNIEIEGIRFNISHHGSVGRRPWTRTNPLNTLAAELIVDSVKFDEDLPDVVIRSHNHTYADTHDNFPVRIISTPAWQLATEFSHRLGFNIPDIGGLIFSCDSGACEVTKKFYRPDGLKVHRI